MWRGLIDAAALFISPFVAYGIYLTLWRRFPATMEEWARGPLSTLGLIGLGLAAAGIFTFYFQEVRHRGAYVPAHIENGQLVPGHIE